MAKSPKQATSASIPQEFNHLFNNFYNLSRFPQIKGFENLNLHPSIDIVDDENTFKVVAEMPGMSEKEVNVSIDQNMLIIKGEKQTSRKDESKNYLIREIGYGCYERAIPLPEFVDLDKVKASFKKGMLWVEIPKKQGTAKKSREIKIEKVKE